MRPLRKHPEATGKKENRFWSGKFVGHSDNCHNPEQAGIVVASGCDSTSPHRSANSSRFSTYRPTVPSSPPNYLRQFIKKDPAVEFHLLSNEVYLLRLYIHMTFRLPQPPNMQLPLPQRRAAGFSLIEVTISLAVVAFALIAIIGLLPAGVGVSTRASMNSAATQIFERMVGDARQTDFSKLIYPSAPQSTDPVTIGKAFRLPNLRYFNDQGTEVVPDNPASLTPEEKAKIVYHVNTRVLTNASLPTDKFGYVGQFLATVTFEIAYNPGNRDLTFTPDGYIQRLPNMEIRTLSIQVAKND
jgi:uncharacterized protein (TIGR02598 family)